MNEPLQMETSAPTGRQKFCESTEYKRAWSKPQGTVQPFMACLQMLCSSPFRSRPVSLPKNLLDWPFPPSASSISFPSWASSSDGFFSLQLCIFFHHLLCIKVLPVLSSLPSTCPSIEAMENGPGTIHLATHFQNIVTPCLLADLVFSPFFSASFYINTVASGCFLQVVKSFVNKPWPLCLGPNRNQTGVGENGATC